MQQDWRRDPIWQLIGTIVAIATALITRFNELAPKIIIIVICVFICEWVYFGN